MRLGAVLPIACAALLLAAGVAHAQLGFEVGTSPYLLPQPPYMEGQRITGRFELDGPLPTWEADFDLRDRLTDFEFDDGVATRTFADSEVCEFRATIDARGQLIDWVLDVRQRPLPPAGQEQHMIRMTSSFSLSGFRAPGDTVCEGPDIPTLSTYAPETRLTPDQPPPAIPPATYRYLGAPFDTVEAPYAVGERFAVTLGFAGPIPASRTSLDLAPFIETLSVQDPVEASFSVLIVCNALASTDAQGRIVDWSMVVTDVDPIILPPANPPLTTPGWSLTPDRDEALRGFGTVCSGSEVVASSEPGGSWRGRTAMPVPALGPWALVVLVLALLVLGLRRSRLAQSLSADR